MHKKQYEAIAQAIKENRATIHHPDFYFMQVLTLEPFLNALCDILAADNKKFDKEKFLEAIKK